jgi:hypothetical protein
MARMPAFATVGSSGRRICLAGFVEGGTDLFDVGAVDADGFVELVAGDVELFGPVMDVGRHLGVDLFRVMGAGLGFGVLGVGGAEFGFLDFFVLVRFGVVGVRHVFGPLFSFFRLDAGRVSRLAHFGWSATFVVSYEVATCFVT